MQKIICINNIINGTKIGGLTLQKTYTIENSLKIDGLTLQKVYIVESYERVDDDVVVWITDDNNQYFAYFMRNFMQLEEWRELQINKIIE